MALVLVKIPTGVLIKSANIVEIKGGKEKIVTPNGEVISCTFDAKPDDMTGIGYIPHWSTCPQTNSFKKR